MTIRCIDMGSVRVSLIRAVEDMNQIDPNDGLPTCFDDILYL